MATWSLNSMDSRFDSVVPDDLQIQAADAHDVCGQIEKMASNKRGVMEVRFEEYTDEVHSWVFIGKRWRAFVNAQCEG